MAHMNAAHVLKPLALMSGFENLLLCHTGVQSLVLVGCNSFISAAMCVAVFSSLDSP